MFLWYNNWIIVSNEEGIVTRGFQQIYCKIYLFLISIFIIHIAISFLFDTQNFWYAGYILRILGRVNVIHCSLLNQFALIFRYLLRDIWLIKRIEKSRTTIEEPLLSLSKKLFQYVQTIRCTIYLGLIYDVKTCWASSRE